MSDMHSPSFPRQESEHRIMGIGHLFCRGFSVHDCQFNVGDISERPRRKQRIDWADEFPLSPLDIERIMGADGRHLFVKTNLDADRGNCMCTFFLSFLHWARSVLRPSPHRSLFSLSSHLFLRLTTSPSTVFILMRWIKINRHSLSAFGRRHIKVRGLQETAGLYSLPGILPMSISSSRIPTGREFSEDIRFSFWDNAFSIHPLEFGWAVAFAVAAFIFFMVYLFQLWYLPHPKAFVIGRT